MKIKNISKGETIITIKTIVNLIRITYEETNRILDSNDSYNSFQRNNIKTIQNKSDIYNNNENRILNSNDSYNSFYGTVVRLPRLPKRSNK